ncbi:winged helix-turn-helix domain-containing protein [Dissulfurirhabdus thermomarina]|uniref:Winged helix-turn-helix domain-containing protein n=1 Tax=Dissulfurirhabdus thermomarina TaxID=1765737 RepID=A0A6N9TS27_DISTH|nr:winged helix-turn-helix domain-containing protein [Dissulfurirhabdus thermomarina]NDY42247.1 winged helix-turn-helix domain-containing protein [Dissulfurirhabdus thermomarina]NMX22978.1 winged helix-turn-helix domain-containing protein [Dissulfurirhabdus thermomarina]
MSTERNDTKEALARLREERAAFIDRARAAAREQNRAVKAILDALGEGGRTVPEIARRTELPTWEVLRYVAGLRKYGRIVEGPKDGDYFTYEAVRRG